MDVDAAAAFTHKKLLSIIAFSFRFEIGRVLAELATPPAVLNPRISA